MEEPFEREVCSQGQKAENRVVKQEGRKDLPAVSPSKQRERVIDPPRQLPARSYSLQPDMINGWKPKNNSKANLNNVFSIHYEQQLVDELVRQLYKRKKGKERLVYLGPRKNNSYVLHENRAYPNPYPMDKKQDQMFSGRKGLPQQTKLEEGPLRFDSDFECGNLDVGVMRSENEYDLFMRADTNTRGHTNWFYFSVSNNQFVGTVKFTLCNFRREKSLYQRGLKPYVYSKLQDSEWHQGGKGVTYQKKRPRYDFLYEDLDSEDEFILNTYFAMSFSYDFLQPDDTVYFAYCIPYPYTRLLRFLNKLENTKSLTPLKTLTGLPIPVLEITDENEPEYNKQVVLVTGRVHPGQSNASFVAEGLLSYLCSPDAKDIRKGYIFYVIPMLNPDGVIAGNYRTSLFGRDLNRTFDQSRRFAFPQTYHLVQFTRQMKQKHKKRFNLYIDLHGHSVKKNVFMYGPQFSIQHANYELSRQFPKIIGGVTSLFRYYSCIFRISGEKATTARAILNRKLDIPFTYTMQASNGFYVDGTTKTDVAFTSQKFREMGVYLCKSFGLLRFDNNYRIRRTQQSQKIAKDEQVGRGNVSDDEISEGKSDSEPENQDLDQKELQKIEECIQGIQGKTEKQEVVEVKPMLTARDEVIIKFESAELRKNKEVAVFLPPLNTRNRAMIFSERSKKKDLLKQQRLRNIESQVDISFAPLRKSQPRYSANQIVTDCRASQDYRPSRLLNGLGGSKYRPGRDTTR